LLYNLVIRDSESSPTHLFDLLKPKRSPAYFMNWTHIHLVPFIQACFSLIYMDVFSAPPAGDDRSDTHII